MCTVVKSLLILAFAFCIAVAHRPDGSGRRCRCLKVRDRVDVSNIRGIQMHPASAFCDKPEIIVTYKNGRDYCLDPTVKRVQAFVAIVMRRSRASATLSPTKPSSFEGSN
ncbi:C-X-C motif chemokine 3-like [Polymixia lowei]